MGRHIHNRQVSLGGEGGAWLEVCVCVGGYSANSHAGDGSLLDLLVDVGGPESLDGAAVDLLHVGLVVKPHGWHVFCA